MSKNTCSADIREVGTKLVDPSTLVDARALTALTMEANNGSSELERESTKA